MAEKMRSVRLSDDDWEGLRRIAETRGILYGGIPSRGAALVALIREALSRINSARRDRAGEKKTEKVY